MEQMLVKYLPSDKVFAANATRGVEEFAPKEQKVAEITGEYIDRKVGLRYCAYNEEMYLEVLEIYCEAYRDKVQQLTENYSKESWKDYTTYVHSLKSASLSVGGVQLSEMAAEVEKAGKDYLKEGSAEKLSYIKAHHDELMKLYQSTVEEIEKNIH